MTKLCGAIMALAIAIPATLTAQDIDPVGLYEWEVNTGDQYMTGTFDIRNGDEGWTGIATSDEGELPMRDIRVSGSVVSFIVNSMAYGEVYLELRVEDERFSGYASVGGDQVPITGTKSGG